MQLLNVNTANKEQESLIIEMNELENPSQGKAISHSHAHISQT